MAGRYRYLCLFQNECLPSLKMGICSDCFPLYISVRLQLPLTFPKGVFYSSSSHRSPAFSAGDTYILKFAGQSPPAAIPQSSIELKRID